MSIAAVDLPRRPSPRLLSRVQSAMGKDGAVALTRLFPPALLSALRAEVLRRHRSGELRRRGLVRDIAGRCTAVLPFSGPFLDERLYAQPGLLAVLGALLGADFRIGSLEAVIALPGAYEQHLHADGPLRFDRVLGRRAKGFAGDLSRLPPYAVTLCVPLCDLTEDNGPTALYPGSHRAALRARVPNEASLKRRFKAQAMTGPLGDCFLFDYRLFHCGLPNFSREPRPILMLVFTRAWFRDPNLADVHPGLVIARKDLAKVPARLRPLFALAPAARRALWD
ncbi:MAG: phytanoyl-CoA dioxygenase family protein [Elusimicrobia bacterium]|nr:phytanoyl-CoA dioxygenase family protein [Elusimicrobiota bacterium]